MMLPSTWMGAARSQPEDVARSSPPQDNQSLHVEHASLERATWDYVHRVYADLSENVQRTARVLGISRTTVKKELAKPRPPW